MNRFQEIDSACLYKSLAGRNDNPIFTRFLSPIDRSKSSALQRERLFCKAKTILGLYFPKIALFRVRVWSHEGKCLNPGANNRFLLHSIHVLKQIRYYYQTTHCWGVNLSLNVLMSFQIKKNLLLVSSTKKLLIYRTYIVLCCKKRYENLIAPPR